MKNNNKSRRPNAAKTAKTNQLNEQRTLRVQTPECDKQRGIISIICIIIIIIIVCVFFCCFSLLLFAFKTIDCLVVWWWWSKYVYRLTNSTYTYAACPCVWYTIICWIFCSFCFVRLTALCVMANEDIFLSCFIWWARRATAKTHHAHVGPWIEQMDSDKEEEEEDVWIVR